MAANYNINIEQGSTFELPLMFTMAGAPIDLTGYTFAGKIRETTSSPSAVANFSFAIANQFTNPGEVTASLSAATTAAIPAAVASASNPRPNKTYIFDIEATKPDLSVHRFIQGNAVLSPEVTK